MFEKIKLPDGMTVLAVSAVSYVSAFLYQWAYLHYFDISYRAIEITIPNLIVSLAAVTFVLLGFDNVASIWREFRGSLDGRNAIHRYIGQLVRTFTGIAVVFMFLFSIGSPFSLSRYVLLGVVMLLAFRAPEPFFWMTIKKLSFKKSLELMYEKFDKGMEDERAQKSFSYMEKYANLVIAGLLLGVAALTAGRGMASSMKYLYVIETHDNIKTVLVQKNEDTLVVKDFNTKTKQLNPGFTLLKISDRQTFQERLQIKK